MSSQASALRKTNLFKQPDFLKFWAGQTISTLGTTISDVAMPLTAVITLNASPAQMGIINALFWLPTLLFGLFAGVWVDRLRRKPVLIGADLGRALLLAFIPLAMVLGVLRIELLYVVIFATGAMTIFFEVANTAFLPTLVSREKLLEGNSKMNTGSSAASVVGPGLGGWLVQVFSAPFAVLLDAVSYLLSAVSLAWIRTPEPPPVPREKGSSNIWKEIAEGLRVIYHDKILWALAGAITMHNFFAGVWSALWELYLVRNLNFSPALVGVVIAAGAPGGLLASLVADRLGSRLGVGRTIILAGLMLWLSQLLVLIERAPVAVLVSVQVLSSFLSGFFLVIFIVNQLSLRQAVTPQPLLGRMSASMRFMTWGVMVFAALASSWLSTWLGVWTIVAIGIGGEILALIRLVFSPIWRVREIPQGE